MEGYGAWLDAQEKSGLRFDGGDGRVFAEGFMRSNGFQGYMEVPGVAENSELVVVDTAELLREVVYECKLRGRTHKVQLGLQVNEDGVMFVVQGAFRREKKLGRSFPDPIEPSRFVHDQYVGKTVAASEWGAGNTNFEAFVGQMTRKNRDEIKDFVARIAFKQVKAKLEDVICIEQRTPGVPFAVKKFEGKKCPDNKQTIPGITSQTQIEFRKDTLALFDTLASASKTQDGRFMVLDRDEIVRFTNGGGGNFYEAVLLFERAFDFMKSALRDVGATDPLIHAGVGDTRECRLRHSNLQYARFLVAGQKAKEALTKCGNSGDVDADYHRYTKWLAVLAEQAVLCITDVDTVRLADCEKVAPRYTALLPVALAYRKMGGVTVKTRSADMFDARKALGKFVGKFVSTALGSVGKTALQSSEKLSGAGGFVAKAINSALEDATKFGADAGGKQAAGMLRNRPWAGGGGKAEWKGWHSRSGGPVARSRAKFRATSSSLATKCRAFFNEADHALKSILTIKAHYRNQEDFRQVRRHDWRAINNALEVTLSCYISVLKIARNAGLPVGYHSFPPNKGYTAPGMWSEWKHVSSMGNYERRMAEMQMDTRVADMMKLSSICLKKNKVRICAADSGKYRTILFMEQREMAVEMAQQDLMNAMQRAYNTVDYDRALADDWSSSDEDEDEDEDGGGGGGDGDGACASAREMLSDLEDPTLCNTDGNVNDIVFAFTKHYKSQILEVYSILEEATQTNTDEARKEAEVRLSTIDRLDLEPDKDEIEHLPSYEEALKLRRADSVNAVAGAINLKSFG